MFFCCSVHSLSQLRRSALERSLKFYQFLQDSEEEETWLVERISLAKSQDVGKDLVMCTMLIKRHEVNTAFCDLRKSFRGFLFQNFWRMD